MDSTLRITLRPPTKASPHLSSDSVEIQPLLWVMAFSFLSLLRWSSCNHDNLVRSHKGYLSDFLMRFAPYMLSVKSGTCYVVEDYQIAKKKIANDHQAGQTH